MGVRRDTPNRLTLYRTCAACGRGIVTTASSPFMRLVQAAGHAKISYYCSERCKAASYKHLFDGRAGDRKRKRDAARSALCPVSREQVEKVWKGEWVKRHKHRGGFRRVTGMDDMGEQQTITIDERYEYDDLYCSKCGKQSPDNFLNFCGYCGAPMTDEAVDMEIKRLEALYGDR